MKIVVALLAAALCGAVSAQSVALHGMLGGKALLIVDGGALKSVSAGETHQGVKVIATSGNEAVVEIKGRRHTLRLGEAPASVGDTGGAALRGSKIVLSAGSGGHFFTQGAINGQAVQFLVDTGATSISLGFEIERCWRHDIHSCVL